MKKTYALNIERKNRDRLLDASKHDIRKYVKRERAKPLAPGSDFWDFDCKLGGSAATVQPVHFAALMAAVDELVKEGADAFYVEVTARAGHRTAKPQTDGHEAEDHEA